MLSQKTTKIRLVFTEDLLGSSPLNKELYTKYIETLKAKRKDPRPEDEPAEAETIEIEEKMTGFMRDEGGIFIYDYAVKGFLKEAGNVLKTALDVKALRQKIDNYWFVDPRRVRIFAPDGTAKKEPDGLNQRPLRAQTPQGPRTALAVSEMVKAGSHLDFTLRMLDGSPLKKEMEILETLLSYGANKGLGQWRNGGYGRFTFTIS
jgi:hypothetical protein